MIASAFSGRSEQQITASALGLMERARARTFQDSLGKSIEVIQKRRAPEATKRLKDVREQLTALLPRQLAASRPDHQLVAEYNRLENEYTRVENEISQEVPLGSASPPELKAVQQALGRGGVDLLVEYWLGDGYLAWVWATPTEAGTGSSRPLPPQMLSDCLASLSDPNEVGWRSKCSEVSQLLLQPIRERSLPSGRRIVIVPDGILQSVPFEVLEMPGGRLLIEQAAVHYVPSAGVLLDRPSDRGWSSRAPWSESLVALGNPVAVKASPAGSFETWEALPHSEEEVLAVARLLPGRKSVHLGAGARKQELPWTGGKSAPILHLATHSTIDLESPDRSRIIFSGTPQTGPFDYLFLREIPDLDLSGTQLVTLSACETSRGKLIGAEGTQDFSRVLMLAGARVTVTSLWRVSDEAASELMQQFYYELSRGEPVSQALREAKLRFLHSKSGFQHPAYWAAFVATGQAGTPLSLPMSWGSSVLGLVVVALGIAAVGVFTRRLKRSRRGKMAFEALQR